jgi:3-oxoacyl-[acyl-carrier protein] reductase
MMPDSKYKLLLFGSTGAIGRAVADSAVARGWAVVATARRLAEAHEGVTHIRVDPFTQDFSAESLRRHGPYSAVCWAQGANTNDNAYNVDLDRHYEVYKANCLFVLATLKALLTADLLVRPARLCVISSIWQMLARQDKLSYCMSKAALQGLVLSASTDLAADGHLFNAVLPGALDTPMTRQNLTPQQIQKLKSATKFQRLPALEDVISLTTFLCSPENTGITGQFVAADLGMSRVHLL